MSSYRNYVPRPRPIYTSRYYSASKFDLSSSRYETSSLSRPSSRAENPRDEKEISKLPSSYRPGSYIPSSTRDRSTSREPTRFGGVGNSTSASTTCSAKDVEKPKEKTVPSLRDKYSSTSTYPSRAELTARIKTALEKKDAPPVTYRTLSRTGARSRDPSPVDKPDTYRLYPRSYTRSSSREPETKSGLKYTSKEDLSHVGTRYGGRLSRSDLKDDVPGRIRTTSVTSLRSESKESLYPRSRTSSVSDSREDLRYKPQEDITSRFRPRTTTKEDLSAVRAALKSTKDEPVLRTGSNRSSRDDSSSSYSSPSSNRYTSSRHNSKEDLTAPSTKSYINSRFLPRNTIEKSYTAYTKPRVLSTTDDKKRRDNFISVLQTQPKIEERKSGLSTSSESKKPPGGTRSEVIKPPTTEKSKDSKGATQAVNESSGSETEVETETETEEEIEMIKVTVVTRGTSPTPPSQSNVPRTRRGEMARVLQKDITRPKIRKDTLVDKEVQSDRLDDTARYSRFGSNRSTYLDLKFTSPRSSSSSKYSTAAYSQKKDSSQSRSRENSLSLDTDKSISELVSDTTELETTSSEKPPSKMEPTPQSPKVSKKLSASSSNESINSLSRNNSSKSIPVKVKEPVKSKSPSPASSKSKLTRHTSLESGTPGKKLPPPVPKSDSAPKLSPANSTQNKDFRKSVLNMNTDGKLVKKTTKRSSSVSSDSEPSSCSSVVVGTDTQINELSSLSSSGKTNKVSKLPTKIPSKTDDPKKSPDKSRRSPSVCSESSTTTSSSEDDLQKQQKNKKMQSAASSRTSMLLTSGDELSMDRPAKPPPSPRTKTEGKTEAKPEMKEELRPEQRTEEAKSFLMRALAPVTNFFRSRQPDAETEDPDSCLLKQDTESKHSDASLEKSNSGSGDSNRKKIVIRRVPSGDNPWWLDESATAPEGVKKYTPPNSAAPETIKKYPRDDQNGTPWWLDENSDVPDAIKKLTMNGSHVEVDDGTSVYKIRRNDSGNVEWWLDSSDSGKSKSSGSKNNKSLKKSDDSKKSRSVSSPRTSSIKKSLTPQTSIESSSSLGEKKIKFTKQDSEEKPWWLDENAQVPEGIQKFATNGSQVEVDDGRHIYKIRRNESGKVEWWMDTGEKTSGGKIQSDHSKSSQSGGDSRNPPKVSQGKTSFDKSALSGGDSKKSSKPSKHSKHSGQSQEGLPGYSLRHQDSGDRAWWLMTNPDIPSGIKNLDDSDSDFDKNEPLGDRASPEGLEMPREEQESARLSPYDNVPSGGFQKPKRPTHIPLFISKHTNIDDILGGGSNQILSPLMDRIYEFQDKGMEDVQEVDAGQVKIHDSTAQRPVIQPNRIDVIDGKCKSSASFTKLDDAALQLYKDGDYGSYLDLEASISEQQEEFEGFQTNKKNSIVLRTQLSVRVHTIIEKLLTSEGRELRRALFSLKQIFQEDKDLVHEFVQNDGLACLIKVGSEADQNYQNYILRALGQVMLYVDGMNGVMENNQTVQWLYTLIASKFRLVVKTALKLLLVFVEYVDSNCMLLIKAVQAVDSAQGQLSWYNIMKLLKDFNSADTELLIYAMTLMNKCLNGIPDQDTYYDQTDALEEQGIEGIIQRYMSKQGTDLDLLQQFQIYEAVLQHEDGEDKGMPLRHLDESIRKTLRNRKSMVDSTERRKSRRHSTGNTPMNVGTNKQKFYSLQANTVDDEDESSSSQSSGPNDHNLNGSYKDNNKASDVGVTPALRRRRERAERQRSFIREQQESAAVLRASLGIVDDQENGNYQNNQQQRMSNGNFQIARNSSRKDLTPLMNAVNKLDSSEEGILKKPWVLQMMYGKGTEDQPELVDENEDGAENESRKMLLQLKRESTVKDLTQKLSSQNILHSPSSEESKISRIGDMSGLISKAKEGLAKSKSKADILKSSPTEPVPPKAEIKKSENELRWEELVHSINRPLNLCDMDFTDLQSEDEVDILAPAASANGVPPPPPPFCRDVAAPPPPPIGVRAPPPPFPTAPMFGIQRPARLNQDAPKSSSTIKKNKKTVKLFWKEVRDDPIALSKLQKLGGMIWDELTPVMIDTQKLEHLFESRAKDLITKKQQEMNKNKEIIVLDHKRSNAINIGMTKLPPPRSIKTAILKMDATIMNREGIEKLLTMLPTEEERTKIQEAQAANPDLPLGSAEQFLLTLASISELPARLKLWAFKLDFENTEREIAEPLMDLKQGIELLKCNKTFRGILSTLLSIGIFLNGNEVKGFQIEYLAKVPEVKDTVHKHSLLHHLCHIVMEKFPEATDLYSEIGAITRASKIDFDELALNVQRLEADCKASWDHLKLIAKHDGSTMMKVKMSDFLADCAERIILLAIVHRRVMNRYHKFLLWLGIPLHRVADSKPNEFCRVVSEFALEYRTTRERVLQQLEKKANHRERNKTRGKMITEVGKFRSKEDRADAELRQLLGSDISDVESLHGTLPWRRQKRDLNSSVLGVPNGNLTDDADDEILESLVKTATKAPSSRTTPRERKRTRHADRKSLRRTLKNGLSEEEKKHIAAYIKGY